MTNGAVGAMTHHHDSSGMTHPHPDSPGMFQHKDEYTESTSQLLYILPASTGQAGRQRVVVTSHLLYVLPASTGQAGMQAEGSGHTQLLYVLPASTGQVWALQSRTRALQISPLFTHTYLYRQCTLIPCTASVP